MSIKDLIMQELIDNTFNVETQSGEKLTVIEKCDFIEITLNILSLIKTEK